MEFTTETIFIFVIAMVVAGAVAGVIAGLLGLEAGLCSFR